MTQAPVSPHLNYCSCFLFPPVSHIPSPPITYCMCNRQSEMITLRPSVCHFSHQKYFPIPLKSIIKSIISNMFRYYSKSENKAQYHLALYNLHSLSCYHFLLSYFPATLGSSLYFEHIGPTQVSGS